MEQTTIFDFLYPKYKIKKPIRLIEFFAGYGSQALALKYLGVEFEHWKICEWAIKSIQAYKDLHFTDDNFDNARHWTRETIVDYLVQKGVSIDYNQPATKTQLMRQDYRKICNNILITHNLVNIQNVHAEDLEIIDTDKYTYLLTYLFTYSFPCQDLSLAGKGKGMKDTSTRSGMLWEVERILSECKELGALPEVLLMENVPQVHNTNNVDDFNKWQLRLEELGYKNYFQDLKATDYGIPQTRSRCFMVSILGNYSYTFPKSIPLNLKLKDLLEDEVDKKYYLSDKQIEYLENGKYNSSKPSKKTEITDKGFCQTLDTMTGGNRQPFVKVKKIGNVNPSGNGMNGEAIDSNGVSSTLTTNKGEGKKVLIRNATKKGYLEATIGDGIDISSRMEHYRGTVQKEKSQTLTTSCDVGVVINPLKGQSGKSWQFEQQVYDENYCARTLKASEGSGNIPKVLKNDLRIRKLTPKECFRLMGVKDEDFENIAKNQSDSSLYHLAGDSIVVNVLMAIFKEMI